MTQTSGKLVSLTKFMCINASFFSEILLFYTRFITCLCCYVKPVSHQSCGTYDLAILAWGTERRDPEADHRHFRKNHRERKAAVRCSHDYLTFTCKAVARRSYEIWKTVVGQNDTSYVPNSVPNSCLTAVLRALRLPCVLQKTHRDRKKNEHVKYLVFDVAAAVRPCLFVGQSCGVVNNTLRLMWNRL